MTLRQEMELTYAKWNNQYQGGHLCNQFCLDQNLGPLILHVPVSLAVFKCVQEYFLPGVNDEICYAKGNIIVQIRHDSVFSHKDVKEICQFCQNQGKHRTTKCVFSWVKWANDQFQLSNLQTLASSSSFALEGYFFLQSLWAKQSENYYSNLNFEQRKLTKSSPFQLLLSFKNSKAPLSMYVIMLCLCHFPLLANVLHHVS